MGLRHACADAFKPAQVVDRCAPAFQGCGSAGTPVLFPGILASQCPACGPSSPALQTHMSKQPQVDGLRVTRLNVMQTVITCIANTRQDSLSVIAGTGKSKQK